LLFVPDAVAVTAAAATTFIFSVADRSRFSSALALSPSSPLPPPPSRPPAPPRARGRTPQLLIVGFDPQSTFSTASSPSPALCTAMLLRSHSIRVERKRQQTSYTSQSLATIVEKPMTLLSFRPPPSPNDDDNDDASSLFSPACVLFLPSVVLILNIVVTVQDVIVRPGNNIRLVPPVVALALLEQPPPPPPPEYQSAGLGE